MSSHWDGDEFEDYTPPTYFSCKYCGMSVIWAPDFYTKGFLLVQENGKIHKCQRNKRKEDAIDSTQVSLKKR